LRQVAQALRKAGFRDPVWLVGGAVRDHLLGTPGGSDWDLVTTGSAEEAVERLRAAGLGEAFTVFPRFRTAAVWIEGQRLEFVTARRESYTHDSRKPFTEVGTVEDDARRRDFTVNTLMADLESGQIVDPMGHGAADLQTGILRTPADPVTTFRDDPLRMLRAVRFRHRLGFAYAPGLASAIESEAHRLEIVSAERIQEELVKIMERPSAADALAELMQLGLLDRFWPEFRAGVGMAQGPFHHLDVWDHTLLALRNGHTADPVVNWAILFHDVAKPATYRVDEEGRIRFFGHESEGEALTRQMMTRLRFPGEMVDRVSALVGGHMRPGSLTNPTRAAARRLRRDFGDDLSALFQVVTADQSALNPSVTPVDLRPLRELVAEEQHTPTSAYESPLNGSEIVSLAGREPGPWVGAAKRYLSDLVVEGQLDTGDREAATRALQDFLNQGAQ
jgi:poly(A) polymerase